MRCLPLKGQKFFSCDVHLFWYIAISLWEYALFHNPLIDSLWSLFNICIHVFLLCISQLLLNISLGCGCWDCVFGIMDLDCFGFDLATACINCGIYHSCCLLWSWKLSCSAFGLLSLWPHWHALIVISKVLTFSPSSNPPLLSKLFIVWWDAFGLLLNIFGALHQLFCSKEEESVSGFTAHNVQMCHVMHNVHQVVVTVGHARLPSQIWGLQITGLSRVILE